MWISWHKPDTRRLEALEEGLEKLERELRNALLDYDNLYEKCRQLMGRIAKRVASGEASTGETPAERPPDSLEAHRQAMQRRILERRARGIPNG